MGFPDNENGFEFLFTVLTTTLRLMEKVHVLALVSLVNYSLKRQQNP